MLTQQSNIELNKRWTEVPVNWNAIKNEIDNAKHGMKGKVKQDISKRLGLSVDQIHTAIREQFGKAKIIVRTDLEQTEEYARNRRIAYMVAEHKEKMKKAGSGERELATWRVLNLFAKWGMEEATNCHESTINRIIREEFGYRQKTPRVRLECSHALQEAQIDFSFSKYFRIVGVDNVTGDYLLKATKQVLEYKEGDKRMRPMLGVIMDSYSRLRYHHAVVCAGESATSTIEFMNQFFRRPDDDLIFRHVAWHFRADNGPLMASQEGKSLWKSIDRPYTTSLPYEKTGIGKAERGWPLIWQLEMELVSEIGIGGIISLTDYNNALLQECVRQQDERHPFYLDQSRKELYQKSILSQTPRPETIEADLSKLVYTFFKRKVKTDQTITINNVMYEVPVWAGDHYTTDRWIRVMINRDGNMIGELIDRNAPTFTIREFKPTMTGTFSGTHAKTFAQRLSKDIESGNSLTEQMRKKATGIKPQQAPARPRALMPQSKPAAINSPFAHLTGQGEEQAPQESHTCSSKFEAITFVSEIMKQHGIEFNDQLYEFFDSYVVDVALDKFEIQKAANSIITEINGTTQTGTH